MKPAITILFSVLVIAQIAIPVSMIHGREKILRDGDLFRFKTQPIDPADPFQGRYVVLRYENDYIAAPESTTQELQRNEPVYALIEPDADGFAMFTGWSRERPGSGAYLKTTCRYPKREWNSETQTKTHLGYLIDLPFDRFYMNEEKAPEAERLARDATRSTNCWATIRILNGKAAIEDVMIEGTSVHTLIDEQ